VSVKSREVTVKGPRGSLTKSFRHLAVDIYMPNKKTVKVKAASGTGPSGANTTT
jgi:large subunit ribosomal protein L9e